jgi:hypothetical protein
MYHHSVVSDLVARTAVVTPLALNATKKTKVQFRPSYLSTTSIETTGIENKQKRPRQIIFPLIDTGTYLQY